MPTQAGLRMTLATRLVFDLMTPMQDASPDDRKMRVWCIACQRMVPESTWGADVEHSQAAMLLSRGSIRGMTAWTDGVKARLQAGQSSHGQAGA